MRSRWLTLGLIASLALNLFVIGAGAGVWAFAAGLARQNPGARPGALFWATEGLPQPDRRQMRQMLKDVRDAAKPAAVQSLALRAAAWGALADAKPDAAAIKQQLARGRQIDLAIRTDAEAKIVDYATRLPPTDRALFAAGMQRQLTPPAKP
jgi:uncharacterized membrane protein